MNMRNTTNGCGYDSQQIESKKVDMNVDARPMKTLSYDVNMKTLDHPFIAKRLTSDHKTLSYHSNHENLEESSFGRPSDSRIEESSVPSILAPHNARNEVNRPEKTFIIRKPMMFSDHNETAKFLKEELKEEVEEEKELHMPRDKSVIFADIRENQSVSNADRNFNDNDEESSKNTEVHNQSHSGTEEDLIDQEDQQDREIDMIIDERIAPRTIVDTRGIGANSFQTRAEMQLSIGNSSNTIPNINLPNEYHQAHNTVNERRLFNRLMGTGSLESSDYEEGENDRMRSSNVVEEQIESIKISFVHTITHEKQQIQDTKKDLKKHKMEFEKFKKQEWERIQLEKDICRENKRRITKLLKDSEDIIDLDIGGTHHVTTTRASLCRFRSSVLAAMFSGRHSMKYNNDRVFMDRDGEPF